MNDEWLTLERAAQHLRLSVRTLRRWIHSGKLRAELRDGPYGRQYVVPLQELAGVQIVRDVERAERREEREAIPRIVEEYLAQREQPILGALDDLRLELSASMRRLEERQDALKAELARIAEALDRLGKHGARAPGPDATGND